jgi:hypothetical protein
VTDVDWTMQSQMRCFTGPEPNQDSASAEAGVDPSIKHQQYKPHAESCSEMQLVQRRRRGFEGGPLVLLILPNRRLWMGWMDNDKERLDSEDEDLGK